MWVVGGSVYRFRVRNFNFFFSRHHFDFERIPSRENAVEHPTPLSLFLTVRGSELHALMLAPIGRVLLLPNCALY